MNNQTKKDVIEEYIVKIQELRINKTEETSQELLNEFATKKNKESKEDVDEMFSDKVTEPIINKLNKVEMNINKFEAIINNYSTRINSSLRLLQNIKKEDSDQKVETENKEKIVKRLKNNIIGVNNKEITNIKNIKEINLNLLNLKKRLELRFSDNEYNELLFIREQRKETNLIDNNISLELFEMVKNEIINKLEVSNNETKKLKLNYMPYRNEIYKLKGIILYYKHMHNTLYNQLLKTYSNKIKQMYIEEYKELWTLFKQITKFKKIQRESLPFTLQTKPAITTNMSRTSLSTQFEDVKSSGYHKAAIDIFNVIISDIIKEQNTITELFSLNNNESYEKYVEAYDPNTKLLESKVEELLAEDNTNKQKQELLLANMKSVFEHVSQEFKHFGDKMFSNDPSVNIGLLSKVEQYKQYCSNTDQEYVLQLLNELQARFRMLVDKFMEEQIKLIKAYTVSVKKRSGVLSVFKTFPMLVDRIELLMENNDTEIPLRHKINDYYEKMIALIFNQAINNQEDNIGINNNETNKQQLNHYIIIMENMFYFTNETQRHTSYNSIISKYNNEAQKIYAEKSKEYINEVVKRPFGKLMEFFAGVSNLLKANKTYEEISYHKNYSKPVIKKIIKEYNSEEIKKALTQMYKRINKHFNSEDSTNSSTILLFKKVINDVQLFVLDQISLYHTLLVNCYNNDALVKLDFDRGDIAVYFEKLDSAYKIK